MLNYNSPKYLEEHHYWYKYLLFIFFSKKTKKAIQKIKSISFLPITPKVQNNHHSKHYKKKY